MALLLLLGMLTVCAAVPQNLTGKMFTFPQQTNTAHVKLPTPVNRLEAVTLCLRTISDLTRNYAPFSLATSNAFNNDFLIFKDRRYRAITLHVRNRLAVFPGMDYRRNMWHSACATWDYVSGVAQLWLDGKPSIRKYITSGSSISGTLSIILGQEQDSHGGRFDTRQSFVGMMTDVHMWNYTVSHCEIKRYTEGQPFTRGNVLNWGALDFQTSGRVLIEEKQTVCP
ncbi:female protein-like [Halichoeres trimaculatus]|uniref:female protein-like n=1 Tax=Halichoeres trimaculatus TaxID=147232 RepID=UPI003D9E3581